MAENSSGPAEFSFSSLEHSPLRCEPPASKAMENYGEACDKYWSWRVLHRVLFVRSTMSEDPSPTVRCSDAPRAVAWAVALGCGVIVGLLLAVGITGLSAGSPAASFGDPEYDKVPVIRVSQPTGIVLALAAGMVIGAAAAVAARSHPLLAALAASVLASGSSVAMVVLLQWHRGRWPVGTIDGRMFVVAAVLLFLICTAGLGAATTMSLCRRRPA